MNNVFHCSAAANCPNEKDKSKPQLLESQQDVVAGLAQNSVKRIAERTFERVSPGSPVNL
jgi:hypothetical protein